ncbi:MAG: DUF1998 domain-containing protein [Planctomycetes bacterium]|nr:DUF1998 domain-containing protein [Planctomycetota bacterium]
MLLLREFARRPRRQNSLETLGLVRLSYPPLARVVNVPPDWTRRRLSIEQWRTFLKLVVDFSVRSVPAVRVPEEMLPWMGWSFRPKEIISPDADPPNGALKYKVVRWPQCRAPRLPRVAVLLMRALELDPEDAQSRAEVDEYLRCAWTDLRQVKLLSLGGDGYALDFDAGSFEEPAVQVEALRDCSICPVTRRALDTVLLDTSPYVTRDFAKTKPTHVEMPEFVVARDNELAAVEAASRTRQWLAQDPRVNAARERGVWTEYSDRIAEWSPYYRIAEHSAQLSQSVLRRFEDAFKSGAINILSCSTTMEMGVDIGGLNAVAMNNAPPGPANYRQRAGRAGRRGESIAMALTLCQASPHGEFVFRNPKWPFETPTHVPKVTLDSAPIVQRHVNAFLLTRFLRSCAENSLQLECGWFFGPVDELSTPWAAFVESLERDPCDEETEDGLRRIVAQSALEPRTADELGQATAASVREIAVMWREQQAALDGLLRRADPESPAALAISRQQQRFQGEYLLMYLGSAAFLPGHGFPSGIVPFVHTTRHDADLERRRGERKERYARERRPYASRSLPSAIGDYAPGRSVTMNGRIYRSQGVTLNWKLPASDKQVSEIQALRQAWRCSSCGSAGLAMTRYANCPACNEALSRVQETLVPAGFTTEFTEGPHANQEHEAPMPILRPWVSARGEDWAPLPDPAAGRQRATNSGLVIHRSAGEHGHGYALCLHCGFADSETSADGDSPELPFRIARHRPLRGGNHRKSEDGLCTGLQSGYAIRRGLMLGGEERTDVFELQLRTGSGRPMNEAQAFSIGVALRDSLCESLGIEGNEVGVSASRSEYHSGDHGYSALLYDTASGGAGYVAQVSELLANLLGAARARLRCPNECDSSCHGCLVGYDTQHDVDRLDRHAALDVLTAEFLDRLRVPDSLQLFGEETRVPTKAIPAAIGAALCEPWVEQLDIFLPHPDSGWVWWDWPLSAMVARLAHQPGAPDVELVLPDDSLAALPDEFRVPLAGILESSEQANVRVCVAGANESTVGHGLRLATVWGKGRSISWAVNVAALLTPGPTWAMASGEAGVVFAQDERMVRAAGRQVIDAARIRPQPTSGVHRIVVRDELDGPLHRVGERLRELISRTVPDLGELLGAGLDSITYSDRYLVSPLSAAVALQMLNGLSAAQTRVDLRTAAMTNPRSGRAWRVDHDWREPRDHQEVLQAATRRVLGPNACLSVAQHTSALPHARKMELSGGGRTWILHFDQGVGFLRRATARDFDFDADPASQADEMLGLKLPVMNEPGRGQDLYVFEAS